MLLENARALHLRTALAETPSTLLVHRLLDLAHDVVVVRRRRLVLPRCEVALRPVPECRFTLAYRRRDLVKLVTNRLVLVGETRRFWK